MILLYCIPSFYNPGGMERVLSEKVNFLAELSEFKIIIVTTDQIGRNLIFPLNKNITIIHLDLDFNIHYSKNLILKFILHKRKISSYKKALKLIINKYQVDCVISMGGKEVEFLYKLKGKFIKIVEFHFGMNYRRQFLESIHKNIFWKILGYIRTFQLKNSVKKIDKIVVLTKNDLLDWSKTHSNVIQIPNPNHLSTRHPSNYKLKNILTVGRLDPQKGYDMLIDAFAKIAVKHPDWTLEIFGQGEWEEYLRKKIEHLNLKNNIFLKGIEYNLDKIYTRGSIYVLSSRYEGFGLVIIEAMTFGLPVVSFDCQHGPNEIITDSVNGFLVAQNDIDKLVEKINILIESESIRNEFGHNAINSVQKFSLDEIMPKWIDLFNTLNK